MVEDPLSLCVEVEVLHHVSKAALLWWTDYIMISPPPPPDRPVYTRKQASIDGDIDIRERANVGNMTVCGARLAGFATRFNHAQQLKWCASGTLERVEVYILKAKVACTCVP